MKYLGIDYGKKKIGLAFSEGEVASPLKVLTVSSLKEAVSKIRQVLKSENIDQIVVGQPESGEARSMVDKFVSEIKGLVQVTVVDETLSSKMARDEMINLGLSKKSRQKEDAYSASLILQNYLDELSS